MYTWKDKVCDGIVMGILGLTCIPLVLFSFPLLVIVKLVDKICHVDYKDRSRHWQM